MALCTVAGIGGGGIANSMLLAFWKFETKNAVAISSFSILVCTIMRFLYNFNTKNPEKKHMNVLDYGLATVMMPTTLAGSQIGGYVLLMFPSMIIQILLTILLAYLSYQTTRKGCELHAKEVAAKRAKLMESSGDVKPEEEESMTASATKVSEITSNERTSQEFGMNATLKSTITTDAGSMVDKLKMGGSTSILEKTVVITEVDEIEEGGLRGSVETIEINDKKFPIHDGNRAEMKELAAIAERESGQK